MDGPSDGDLELRDCRLCGGEQWFEVPGCPDGHGEGCPERACTACGSALLVGLPVGRSVTSRRSHLAVVA